VTVGVIAAQGPMVRDRPAGAMRIARAMCVVVDIVVVGVPMEGPILKGQDRCAGVMRTV